MASATDFSALLSIPVSNTEKPKPLPVGTYFAVVKGWEPVESGQKKTPGVKIAMQLQSADEDVDQDELAEAGGEAKVMNRKVSTTFWLTDDSTYRLREFIEIACKLDLGDRTYAELLPEIVDTQVKVEIRHRMTDRNDVLLDVGNVMSAD